MKQKLVTIIVIVVLVIGGGYYAFQKIMPPPPDEQTGPVYTTKPVIRGDISVGVEAVGQLNSSGYGGIQVPGSRMGMVMGGSVGGITYMIDEAFIEEGTEVVKGQLLVRLIAPGLDDKIATAERNLERKKESLARLLDIPVEQLDNVDPGRGIAITTPISGRISGLTMIEGKKIEVGDTVAKVVDDSHFRLVAKLTSSEITSVTPGQKVALRFSQFDGVVEGKIIDVNYSPIAEPASSLLDSLGSSGGDSDEYIFVHWVNIEAENPGLVMPQMRVKIGFPAGEDKSKLDINNIRWARYDSRVDGFVDEETIFSPKEATVTKIFVKNGQTVKAGDQIISLAGEDARKDIDRDLAEIYQMEEDLRALYKTYDNLEIRASMDGVISYVNIDLNRELQPGEWLGDIYNTADMRMWSEIDDIDILLVQQGAPVKVTVDALPGTTLEGEVNRISSYNMGDGKTRFQVDIK
ncbi:MAG: HlyD family efflux transporter periplasmic adaptor subunit, partial [Bacillota bacterium]